MISRALAPAASPLAVLVLVVGAAGCGSSKSSSSAATGNYHRGEFCSKHKQAAYRAVGLKCKKVHGSYRLQ